MGEILSVKNVDKNFPGVKALSGVDFSLREGEIHALMGENGAGKSTLIKVITGFHSKDNGSIKFDGKEINYQSPNEAVQNGISTVYQEINLIPMLSVAENIFLGRQPQLTGPLKGIDWKKLTEKAKAAMALLDLDLDVSLPLNSYPVAIQQMVSIARALDISAKVLILDEPTSSLDTQEVNQLFKVMRKLKARGISIIFITHFLDQVYQISDRITVLRDGKFIGVYPTKEIKKIDLISNMLGQELKTLESSHWKNENEEESETLLSLRNVKKAGVINEFSLDIRKGEVLGLAGLLGSGRTEIANVLYGVVNPDKGEYVLKGSKKRINNPREAIAAGMGYCPEDRKEAGIIPELSVRDNIILAIQAKKGIFKYISNEEREKIAQKYVDLLKIKTPDIHRSIKTLSGGNQQKCIIARWLAANPEILILDEPTRGIDVGAKIEIQKAILDLKKKGLSIIFISSELEEVVRISNRVAVLKDRSITKELSGKAIDEQTIMQSIAET